MAPPKRSTAWRGHCSAVSHRASRVRSSSHRASAPQRVSGSVHRWWSGMAVGPLVLFVTSGDSSRLPFVDLRVDERDAVVTEPHQLREPPRLAEPAEMLFAVPHAPRRLTDRQECRYVNYPSSGHKKTRRIGGCGVAAGAIGAAAMVSFRSWTWKTRHGWAGRVGLQGTCRHTGAHGKSSADDTVSRGQKNPLVTLAGVNRRKVGPARLELAAVRLKVGCSTI